MNAPTPPRGWVISAPPGPHVGAVWFVLGALWIMWGAAVSAIALVIFGLLRVIGNMDCGSDCGPDPLSSLFAAYVGFGIAMVVVGIAVVVRPGRVSGFISLVASLVGMGSSAVVLLATPHAHLSIAGLGIGAALVILSAVALRRPPTDPALSARLSGADPR